MNSKKLITLSIIIISISIILKMLVVGFKNIKIDDFKPASVIFIMDSSASNQDKLLVQKKFVKQMCAQLDPEDHIKIIRLSQDSYLIYEGSPQNSSGITKSMDSFTQYDANENGTAYGLGLKKAFSYALLMKKEGYEPSVVVLGDLENEGDITKQLNWEVLPKNVENVRKYIPELTMMFLFAHPQKLDMVKEKLAPVLGEKKLIVAPEENVEKSLRNFLTAIGR